MKNIHLSVPEKHYSFIMKLIKSFDYVKIEDTVVTPPPTKKEFLDGMRNAIEDVKQIKAGKKKGKPFQQLLDEL
ncbi:MAG: hypothetical protein K9G49_04485 [Taibaiella sp.]|nr:hypothetical protein [Taibaiella sp.]